MAHDLAANAPAAFKQRDDRHFSLFRATSNALLFSTDVSLVHFDRAGKFVVENWIAQGMAYSVLHEKGGSVAAQAQDALQLQR